MTGKPKLLRFKKKDFRFILQSKTDSQAPKIPFRDCWLALLSSTESCQNDNYIVRRLSTKKTQILHRMRLKKLGLTRPYRPNIPVKITIWRWDSNTARRLVDYFMVSGFWLRKNWHKKRQLAGYGLMPTKRRRERRSWRLRHRRWTQQREEWKWCHWKWNTHETGQQPRCDVSVDRTAWYGSRWKWRHQRIKRWGTTFKRRRTYVHIFDLILPPTWLMRTYTSQICNLRPH